MDLLKDPEEKIKCPYDPAHYIMRKRMNTHLVKCKKNPKSKLVSCEFNVNHKIPEPELQYHHENCPDRKNIESMVYHDEGAHYNKFPIQNIEVKAEESWDNLNVPSYDPSKYCAENAVLRHKDVASAAQRKYFRMEERSRINQLNYQKPSQSKPGFSKSTVDEEDNKPLKKDLPEKSNDHDEKENVPEVVASVMERLQLGKGEVFVPKQKEKN